MVVRFLAAALFLVFVASVHAQESKLTVHPSRVQLSGKGAAQQLLLTESKAGKKQDRTRHAQYRSANLAVARVQPGGMVIATGTGKTKIVAEVEGVVWEVDVNVEGGDTVLPVTFEKDILPILARTGCNSGPCHGKARGQNGFQLSLLGYDPDFDYHAIANEGRGRRVLPSSPDASMMLRKPAGLTSHGGGKKLPMDSAHYQTFRRWIESGMPRTPATEPKLERISVEPAEVILSFKSDQQIVVTGHYSDGTSRDVTHLAMFQSNESVIASVTTEGLIRSGPLPGEAAIMARFMEKFAVCNILIPQPKTIPAELYAKLPRKNFIDGLVWDKLQKLNITPSEPAGDTTFLRRAYLDAIGRLPTPDEVKTFLADKSPDKREKLIDVLLDRPEYADFWANKWADLLRPNPYRVGIKSVLTLDSFLRDSFRQNKPYDRFVREIITAQGSNFRNGATVFFRDRREPDEITTMVSQMFLGVRLECAKCHHHPFEIWSQDDFYSFAAYFSRMGRKGVGLSPPISGGEEVLFTGGKTIVKHPVTGKAMSPRPLFGKAAEVEEETDPRRVLADWIVSDANPFFARVAVNRVWADLMGRGIVDPVDDLRATNPPSNGPLLDALADHFRKEKYDLKKLLRTIMTSHVYGLSSQPTPENMADLRNYSRHYRQRLRAEVLLDAVTDITQLPEKFTSSPAGTRSMALWTVRTESFFLDTFSRPDPNQDPPCERSSETSVVQALHLMNSPALHQKVTSDAGRAAQLAASKKNTEEIAVELYLLVYSRRPDDAEMAVCRRIFATLPRRQAVEDLMWTLLNTPEFILKD